MLLLKTRRPVNRPVKLFFSRYMHVTACSLAPTELFHLVSVTSHTKHDENRKLSFNTVCKQPLFIEWRFISVAQSLFAHVGVGWTYLHPDMKTHGFSQINFSRPAVGALPV